MARDEQITVKLVKDDASFKAMKDEADKLKNSFGSIKVGDVKGYAALAKAEKDLATAALNRAKADKISADSAIQKEKADRAAAQAAIARLKQEQQQAKTDLANAKTKTQLAKTETELARAQEKRAKANAAASNAEIKATTSVINLQARLQKEYDKTSAAKKKAEAADKKEAFKGYLERAKDAEKLANALAKMGTEIGKVNTSQAKSYSSMSNYIRQIDGLENATVKATGAIRNAAGTFQTYQVSTANADGTTQKFRIAVDEATGQVYQLDQGLVMTSNGANSFASSISKAGKQLTSTLKTLVGFYGVAQSLRYAFREMKSMSDEMIVYQKITKATAEEMDRLRASSYDVAKKYGQTPTDFLSAAQEMARAGYKDQSAAMAELAIKTKLVGDITADQASKFLLAVDAGYKYGGSIEKLSMVLDQANEIGNNYATSIDKISEGMTLVASLGAQANVSIEELMAALGTMTAATQRSGSEMARALRFIMLGVLGDTTTEVEEGITVTAEEVDSLTTALQHYAPAVVDAAKASGKLINPMEAIGALAKAYKEGLLGGEEDLFKIAKELAGQRYYNAFAALIANWDNMYEEMLEKEKNAAGSANNEIEVLVQGWTQKLNKLKAQWISMVDASINEGVIKWLIDAGEKTLEWAGSLGNLALMIGGVTTAIKVLSTAMQRYNYLNGLAQITGGTKVSYLSQIGTAGKIGIGIGVAGALTGVALSFINSIKQAKEEAIQAAVKAAQEQLGKTEQEIDKYRSLFEISEKYKKIYSDGIVTDEEKSQLVSMQEQLNTLLGDQAKAIDLVNGKYGDMQKAIDDALVSQQNLTKESLNRALAETYVAFAGIDLVPGLHGSFGGNYSDTSFYVRQQDKSPIPFRNIENFNKYFSYRKGGNKGYQYANLTLTKPDTIAGMLEMYQVVLDMLDELDSIDGYAEKYTDNYQAILSLKTQFDNAGLAVAYQLYKAWEETQTKTEESTETTEDGADASKKAADAMDAEAKSATKLAQAISNATNAKDKFDKAMESTKADAMNGYASAYSTLDTEIKEGRVNSTAFYAAARMILGDELFNLTGGTSMNVMSALRNRGASGSILEALDILNATYKDKNGNVVQGLGVYELLSKTKGIDQSQLVTADGKLRIPDFTEAELKEISKQWGGIAPDMLKAWFNALDQYDILGSMTEDVKSAMEQKETSAADSLDAVATNGEAAAEALDAVAEAAGKAAEGGAGETSAERISRIFGGMTDQEFVDWYRAFDNDIRTKAKTHADVMSEYGLSVEDFQPLFNMFYEAEQRLKEAAGSANKQSNGATTYAVYDDDEEDVSFEDGIIPIKADTSEAEKNVKEFISEIPSEVPVAIRTYTTGSAVTRSDYTHTSGGNAVTSWLGGLFSPLHMYASGTQGHPGGPALLNDGNGPELVVDRGRAFIAGGGRPTVMNLHRGAKVFSAGKTSALLGRSSIPAYAEGTPNSESASGGVAGFIAGILDMMGYTREKPEGSNTGSTSSSGGNSGPKVDKESYTKLQTLMNYILNRLNTALEEQTAIIDKQIAALQKEREIQEEQDKLEELQKNLSDAMNERTVRYLGDDGKWHWMADANKVQKAQEELDKYKEELEYNAKIDALEQQKTDLQDQLSEITKVWQEIQDAVETPTGDINELLAAVLKNGTAPQKKAAEYIQNLLIGKLLNGGIYSGNYDEALTAIQAANNGSPFMPTELSYTLASLIAQTGAHESVGDVTESLMQTANGVAVGGTSSRNVYGSPQTFYNYYINGLELGSDQANRPLSDILQDLTVYTNATVH